MGRFTTAKRWGAAVGLATLSGIGCSKPNPSAACIAPETVAGVRAALFNSLQASLPPQLRPRSADDIKATLSLDLARLSKIDQTTGKIDCAANATLKLNPGIKTDLHVDTVSDPVTYSIQPTASGSQFVYEVSEAPNVLRLMMIASAQPEPSAPPPAAVAAEAKPAAGSTPINLPGEISVNTELCSSTKPDECRSTTEEEPVEVLSVEGDEATVRQGQKVYTSASRQITIIYKDCRLSVNSYLEKSFCPGVN